MEQGQWIDIEIQESKDPHFSSVNIHCSIRHGKQVNREEDGASIMTKLLMNGRETIRQYRILVRRDEEGLRQCSALVDRKVGISSGKRWRTKQKVSILLEPKLSSIFVLSGHSRPFRRSLFWKCSHRSCIATQCTCYQRISPDMFITSETEKKRNHY